MRNLRNIFSGFFSTLAVICMLQTAMFLHSHTIDGQTVYYSHPLSDSDCDHSHSKSELDFLLLVSIVGAVASTSIIVEPAATLEICSEYNVSHFEVLGGTQIFKQTRVLPVYC